MIRRGFGQMGNNIGAKIRGPNVQWSLSLSKAWLAIAPNEPITHKTNIK